MLMVLLIGLPQPKPPGWCPGEVLKTQIVERIELFPEGVLTLTMLLAFELCQPKPPALYPVKVLKLWIPRMIELFPGVVLMLKIEMMV